MELKLKVIILIFVGIVAFSVSVITNIIGMSQALNKNSDSSGIVGFSFRKSKSTSLGIDKETKVDDEGKIPETDILVNCLPIIQLNNNKWDRLDAQFSGFQLDENGNAVFKEGYTLYCNGKHVNYVIFNNTYKGEVIGHLKVGTDFKTIEKTLGTPTFKAKEYLGYKTKQVYAFFYENEISIYPKNANSNKSLEDLFERYLNKTYTKDRTHFLVDIREDYEDFTIEMNDENNTVIITSVERQVIAKLDSLGNIEVEFYNGYEVANEKTKEYIDKKLYSTNEEDLVEIMENERIAKNR